MAKGTKSCYLIKISRKTFVVDLRIIIKVYLRSRRSTKTGSQAMRSGRVGICWKAEREADGPSCSADCTSRLAHSISTDIWSSGPHSEEGAHLPPRATTRENSRVANRDQLRVANMQHMLISRRVSNFICCRSSI